VKLEKLNVPALPYVLREQPSTARELMPTRRGFLSSTLAVATLPAVASGTVLDKQPVVRVIAESICGDTNSFANRFGMHLQSLCSDPTKVLFDLENEISDGGVDLIYGLTRPSTQFLVEQIALPHRFEKTYEGQHQYMDGRLVHTLCGPEEPIDLLTQRLTIDPGIWACDLADAVGLLGASAGGSRERKFEVANEIPSASSRYLVSWLFKALI
jgi:hypothetical protein